jgi:hypothetical protein
LQKLRILNPNLRIMASIVCNDEIIGLCENDATRVTLEDCLVQYLHEQGLDGIEFDCKIKYTENNVTLMQTICFETLIIFRFLPLFSQHGFVSLVSGLHRRLDTQNHILSLSISAETAITAATHEFFKTNAW